jgi:hypothetical protein
MLRINTILMLVLTASFSLNAQSAIISFNYQAEVDRLFPTSASQIIPNDFFIQVGDILTASIIIDTNSAILSNDISNNEKVYRLIPPFGQLTINASINGASGSSTAGLIRVINDFNTGSTTYDRYALSTIGFSGDTTNGLTWVTSAIILTDTDASVFNDASLAEAFSLNDFEIARFSLFFSDADNQPIVQASGFGTITPVPVPAAIFFLASGLLGMAGMRKMLYRI